VFFNKKKESFTAIKGKIVIDKVLTLQLEEKKVMDLDLLDGVIHLKNYTGRLCKDSGICLDYKLIEEMSDENKRQARQRKILARQDMDRKNIANMTARIKKLLNDQQVKMRRLELAENQEYSAKILRTDVDNRTFVKAMDEKRKQLQNRIETLIKYIEYLNSERHPLYTQQQDEINKIIEDWNKRNMKYVKYIEPFFQNKNPKLYTVNVHVEYTVKVENNASYEEIINNITSVHYQVTCNDMSFYDNFNTYVCMGDIKCKKYDIGDSIVTKKQGSDYDILVTKIRIDPIKV
jgi:hypothetical protein